MMFLAAFTSAFQAKPQATRRKSAWLSRESARVCPHTEHHWFVKSGLTFSALVTGWLISPSGGGTMPLVI